jgi:hypothetical protein
MTISTEIDSLQERVRGKLKIDGLKVHQKVADSNRRLGKKQG